MARSYTDLSEFRMSLSDAFDVSENFNENLAKAKSKSAEVNEEGSPLKMSKLVTK